jgi:hypothetical protein
MNRVDFLNNILLRYTAFLNRELVPAEGEHGKWIRHYVQEFRYKHDTPFPGWTCYNSETGELMDYSAYATVDVTPENARTVLQGLATKKRVQNLTAKECEDLMLGNMNGMMRLDTVLKKANNYVELKNAMSKWTM